MKTRQSFLFQSGLFRFVLLLIALGLVAMLAACGGGGGGHSIPPPPPTISVAFSPAAPASLQTSVTQALTAVVSNDTSSTPQVAWSVTCGSSGACGGFSPATTASGTATTYTTPPAIPTGNTVTVTATSVTDSTKSVSATITITAGGPTPLADGTYIFSLAGETTTTSGTGLYNVSGAFVVSSGAITSGEQDYGDAFIYAPQDSITSGTIGTTADGNLQIVLTTNDPTNVGVNGVETIDAAMFSTTRGRIIAFDSNATSSGRVDLQDSTAVTTTPTAGYAFFIAGLDTSDNAVAIGGVINIDGSGAISGTGSVFDGNDDGTLFSGQALTASTVSAPDTFGRVLFTLNASDTTDFPQINLAGYIVDASHIRLVEEEPSGTNFNGTTGGVALGQGTNTGTFSSTTVSGNSYVVGLEGADTSGVLQTAGVLTTNSGAVTGAVNYNDLSGTGPQTPSPITGGTYTVDPTGRVTMTGVSDGIATFNIQLYLTGSGLEAEETAITMDAGDVQTGLGFQQTGGGTFTTASFAGTYVMGATGADTSTNENELDAVGPITATSTLAGTVDLNYFSVSQTAALPVSGTFTASANGAFTGTITGLDVTTATNADVFSYYLIDTTKLFAIETDTNQLTLGFFTLEQ
jgi:hypothetical protein